MTKLLFSLSSLSFVGYAIGFLNQILIADKFGTSPDLDIYLLTLSVVNFGWLFIGPVNEISIPDFFKHTKISNDLGSVYFSRVLNIIIIISILMIFLIYFSLSNIFEYVSSGSNINYLKFKENIILLLPIILFTSISQYFQVILNSLSHYIAQSIGKIITASISVLILFLYFDVFGIKAIIIGMEIGLVIFSIFQFYFISKLNIYYKPFEGIILDKMYYKNILVLLGSYLLSSLQLVYEKFVFLSFGNGVLSSYNYSQALLQVPQMIVMTGVVAIVSTNFMNKIHENKLDLGLDNLFSISINAFVIGMFVAVTTSIYSEEIIYVLFFRGMFNINSFEQTSYILFLLIYAFPFIVLSNILGRAFVVLKKVKILVFINLLSALSFIFFLFISYLFKSLFLAIVSTLIINLVIIIYKLSIYNELYTDNNRKSKLLFIKLIKKMPVIFIYAAILFFFKYILNINYEIEKTKLFFKLIIIGIIFSMSIFIYFKFFNKDHYEEKL